jgi:hypothetical protein
VSRALVAAALVIAAPATAAAYCRKSVCDGGRAGRRCVPEGPDDCGVALRWPTPCVTYSLTERGPAELPLASRAALLETAAATWMGADCGGGTHPRIRLAHRGPVACGSHEYNTRRGNANIVAFLAPPWPDRAVLAQTSLSYGQSSGEIYDADLEFHWGRLGPRTIGPELASIALHEVGHFLGLAHSAAAHAVMSEEVHGGAGPLALSADDAAAICAAYPPGAPLPSCDAAMPRHGLKSLCTASVEAPAGGGCAARGGAGLADALVLLGALRRHTGRRRARPARTGDDPWMFLR